MNSSPSSAESPSAIAPSAIAPSCNSTILCCVMRCFSRWKSIILSLLGGAFMALAFLPFDISVIAWVGLIPLLSALWTGKRGFWRGALHGWLYGMAWYSISFWWIHKVGYVFQIPLPVFLSVAFFPLMAYFSLMPALWAGIANTLLRPAFAPDPDMNSTSASRYKSTSKRKQEINVDKRKNAWHEWATLDMLSSIRCAIGLAALWVCIEWLRGHGTLAFNWNSLGMALYEGLSLVQWAEFVGTSALSFLPAGMSVIIYCALRRSFRHFKGMQRGCRPWDFYAYLLIIFGLFMGGLSISQSYSPGQLFKKESVLQVPVLAVQTNLGQHERMNIRQESPHILSERYILSTVNAYQQIQKDAVLAATRDSEIAIKQQLPLLVVWPESALGYPFWRNSEDNSIIPDPHTLNSLFNEETGLPAAQKFVREMGGQDFVLFAGVDELILENRTSITGVYNSMAIIEDGFEGLRTQPKQHLMPFGEYIPFVEEIEWIGKVYSEITGTQTGEGIRPGTGDEPISIKLPGMDESIGIIPAVCYEDTIGDLLTKYVRKGPQIIVNISNDAWFSESICGEQQARNAAFRCIELRRPMVRSANMGLTCSIAPNGGFIDELRRGDGGVWRDGYSYALLPVDKDAGLTIYAQYGDWAVALCAFLAVLLSLAGINKKQTRGKKTIGEASADALGDGVLRGLGQIADKI